jgi:D-amino-acid oxidase
VVGGGVTGITTAVLLQVSGHPTVIYAAATPTDHPPGRPAAFASLHAAASIHPHSVASPHSLRWTETSQAYFTALAVQPGTAVRSQRHYELFEDHEARPPSYASAVREFELLDDASVHSRGAPARPGAESVSGWSFSALFCEAPEYLRLLYSLYGALGGEIIRVARDGGAPDMTDYLARDHLIYVICAGQASIKLLSTARSSSRYTDAPLEGAFSPLLDRCGAKLIRGHYLKLNLTAELRDNDGRRYAYNYTPISELYPTAAGKAADVYCYPRSSGWLLGGSRQVGRVDDRGRWSGEGSATKEIMFPGVGSAVAIPAPIFGLNRELLRPTIDLDSLREHRPASLVAGIGLRFVRDSDHDNVRLEASRVSDRDREKIVIHNYGHGGAGYALSWGCALDVLGTVDRSKPRSSPPAVTDDRLDRIRLALTDVTGRLEREN